MKKKNNNYYIPIFIAILIVIIIFGKDIANFFGIDFFKTKFENNLENLNEMNKKYNVGLYTFSSTIEEDKLLLEDLNELKNIKVSDPFKLLLDFRIKLVESDIFFKEGWKYGRGSTTKYGFGCRKGLPRLRNATFNRNMSSTIGFEAVTIMNKLIENYPKEAEIADVTSGKVIFLNTSFKREQKNALRDRRIVEIGCAKKEKS